MPHQATGGYHRPLDYSILQQVMADYKVTIVVLHVTMQKVDVAMGSMGSMDNYGIYIVLSQTVADMGR